MRWAVWGAAALLSACTWPPPNAAICTSTVDLQASLSDRDAPIPDGVEPSVIRIARLETFAKECVHRWAYRLATAAGENRELAEAARNACEDPIRTYAFESAVRYEEDLRQARQQARAEMYDLALFHVVQARAGHCVSR